MLNLVSDKPLWTSARLGTIQVEAIHYLQQAGIENPELEVRWLLCDILHIDRTALFLESSQILSATHIEAITHIMMQRAHRVPVARILGEREFWGLSFGLNEATLEPRPDSETLIETTLHLIQDKDASLRLLDLGTGSGCLLLALLHNLPHATGLGIDIADRALDQARTNAAQLHLAERATFKINHWVENLTEKFDIILSNPPYIPSKDIPFLMPEVRDHDPLIALDGGHDGLVIYRELIPCLPALLKPHGKTVLEVGHDQAEHVASLMAKLYQSVTITKDLNGLDRCVVGINPI